MLKRIIHSISIPILLAAGWPASGIGATFIPETAFTITGGHLVLTPDERLLVGDMMFSPPGDSRGAVFQPWQNGIIYYSFAANVTASQQTAFETACQAWTVGTPLQCVRRTSQPNYVHVQTHTGEHCNGAWVSCADVGMRGGRQHLFVYSGSWSDQGLLQHEIGHSIGMIHEHQRADRDSYVYIMWQNVEAGREDQFQEFTAGRPMTEYDFHSVMHYNNCAFARPGTGCTSTTPTLQTIVPRACDRDLVGGTVITQLDRDALRNVYSASLQEVLVRDRNQSCGTIDYTPDQLTAVCGGPNCPTASAVRYKKVDVLTDNWCGMHAPVYPVAYCGPINKTYMTHWWDHDPYSCGNLSLQTLHELWVQCGCAYQVVQAECTNIDRFRTDMISTYDTSRPDWRISRVMYFREVMEELSRQGLIGFDVVGYLGEFYQINFLDPRFETKMAKVRAGVYSYAHWKRSIEPGYILNLDTFRKIAAYRRLRIE